MKSAKLSELEPNGSKTPVLLFTLLLDQPSLGAAGLDGPLLPFGGPGLGGGPDDFPFFGGNSGAGDVDLPKASLLVGF